MNNAEAPRCPMHDNVDRRKSAPIATRNTRPDPGAHWVKNPDLARTVLRSKEAKQAGAGAEFVKLDPPEHAPVFFLDGVEHHRKRIKTQRFLSPKAVSERHLKVMEEVTDGLMKKFQAEGKFKLEDLSFELAVGVVSDILGLTNSDQAARADRMKRVLNATMGRRGRGLSGYVANLKRAFHVLNFFHKDVKPAIKERRLAPKNDAMSFYLEDNYSNKAIIAECLTYGSAGMLTTREFIVMAAWYFFDDEELRKRYLEGGEDEQMAILLEIIRLEPVAAMVHRRVDEAVEDKEGHAFPPGERYGIDIRNTNVDQRLVGECPFAVDPERAEKQKDSGRFLTFSDGPHNCPGWLVAMQETRIFLDRLFRLPGLRLEKEPDVLWNDGLKSYELREAWITCDKAGA